MHTSGHKGETGKSQSPWKIKYIGRVLAVSLGLHFNAVIGAYFSPFLFRRIVDYGLVKDRSEAGYYAWVYNWKLLLRASYYVTDVGENY